MSISDTPTTTSQPSDSSSTSANSSSSGSSSPCGNSVKRRETLGASSSDSDSDTPPILSSWKRGETSPVTCPASKRAKIDDNASNIRFIERFLECSVCLDFSISPIYNCDNAHFLCGRCAPNFSVCPTCQDPRLSPSPACEKLAEEANKKIQCENFEAGCKEGVLSTKFLQHLPLCYFREITCLCRETVQFHQFIKHLTGAHKKVMHLGPKFTETYLYDKKIHVNGVWQRTYSPVKFGCHQLVACGRISSKSNSFFTWLCILGDKKDADKYIYEIELKRTDSFKSDCTWRLPVLPFHEIPENESEAKLFENSAVLSIPLQGVGKFGKIIEDKHFFNVTYKIKEI